MKKIGIFVFLFLFTSSGFAADSFERVLIPVAVLGSVPGQFGSRWHSDFTIYNHGLTQISLIEDVTGFYPCYETGPCLFPLQPGHSASPGFNFPHPDAPFPSTVMLYAKQSVLGDVSLSLKVSAYNIDVDAGVDIPVVRERDALTSSSALAGVFIDSGNRGTLRLYDFDARTTADFLVRFRAIDGTVLAERVLSTAGSGVPEPRQPGYLELPLQTVDELRDVSQTLNIDVIPLTDGVRYWALASTTNNATQRVTISTPH